MKLAYLKLENFQGIRDLSIFFDGHDASIYGDNGTGKTTVYNAITWLLFDRSSTGAKNYSPKTKNANGDEHYLDHSSEATFTMPDGTKITLKKTLKEVYKRKRGSANEEFDGHTIDYFINGVPVKEKDFTATVNGWFGGDPERAKILTSPHYFAETFPWDRRRTALLDICGDISDEDIINGDPELEELNTVLAVPGNESARYSPEEYRKIASARKTEINKQLATIPARIDEANKAIPDINGIDAAAIELTVAEIDRKITDLTAKRSAASGNGVDLSVLESLKAQKEQARAEHIKAHNELNAAVTAEISVAQSESRDAVIRLSRAKNELSEKESERDRMERGRAELLKEYTEASALKFSSASEICPTCQRRLPEDKVDELRSAFNKRKKARLEDINQRGQSVSKERIEAITAEIKHLKDTVALLEIEYKNKTDHVAELNGKVTAIIPFETTAKAKEISQLIEIENARIEEASKNFGAALGNVDAELSVLRAERVAEEEKLAKLNLAKIQTERIRELSALEKTLCAEFEELDRGIFLCEEFLRKKVAALDSRINSRFETVRFRLFVEQINGGLKDDCEVMIPTDDGRMVPYAFANNAARINAGIEIINVLSAHWGQSAPLIVDNAESVTSLRTSDLQIIRLVVSEADKTLRTELN